MWRHEDGRAYPANTGDNNHENTITNQNEQYNPPHQEPGYNSFENKAGNVQNSPYPQQNQQFVQGSPYEQNQIRMFPERETRSVNLTTPENGGLQTAQTIGNIWPGQQQQQIYQMAQGPTKSTENQEQQMVQLPCHRQYGQNDCQLGVNPQISQQGMRIQQNYQQQTPVHQNSLGYSNIHQNIVAQQYDHQNGFQQPMIPQGSSYNRQENPMSRQPLIEDRIVQQGMHSHDFENVNQRQIPQQHVSQQYIPQQQIYQQHIPQQYTPQQQITQQYTPQQQMIQQYTPQQHVPQQYTLQQHIPQQNIPHQQISQQYVTQQYIPQQNVTEPDIPQPYGTQQSQPSHYSETTYNPQQLVQDSDRKVPLEQECAQASLHRMETENQTRNNEYSSTTSNYPHQHHIDPATVSITKQQYPQILTRQQSPNYGHQPRMRGQYQYNSQIHQQPRSVDNIHQIQQRTAPTHSYQELSARNQQIRRDVQDYQYVNPGTTKQQPEFSKQEDQTVGKKELQSETVHSLLQVDPKYFKPDPIQIKQPSNLPARYTAPRMKREETVASLLNAELEFFENGLLKDEYRVSSRPPRYHHESSYQETQERPRQTPAFQRDLRMMNAHPQAAPQNQVYTNQVPQSTRQQNPYQDNFTAEQHEKHSEQSNQHQDPNQQSRSRPEFVPANYHPEEQILNQRSQLDVRNQTNQHYTSSDSQDYNHQYREQPVAVANQYDTQQQAYSVRQQQYQQPAPEQITYETQQYQTDTQNTQHVETTSQQRLPQHHAEGPITALVKTRDHQAQDSVHKKPVAEVPVEVAEKKTENTPPASVRQSSYIANDFVPHPEGQNKVCANTKLKSRYCLMIFLQKSIFIIFSMQNIFQ